MSPLLKTVLITTGVVAVAAGATFGAIYLDSKRKREAAAAHALAMAAQRAKLAANAGNAVQSAPGTEN